LKIFAFIKTYESVIAHVLTILGIAIVVYQLMQSNEHKRWENYNSLNLRYYSLYSEIPTVLKSDSCKPFKFQDKKVKVWVRSYFNLYSEEYWLYLNNLIPEEMWTIRINNGVDVNLLRYPLLVRGYEYWKEQGAFVHPNDFKKLVEDKIKSLNQELKLLECK